MSGTVAANAARTQHRLKRIEDYRRLTRDAGVPAKVARQEVGITLGTALDYERQITGMSGVERFQARVDQYAALLQQGLTRTQACAKLAVTNRTGYNYERALARTQTPGVATPGATEAAPGPVALPGQTAAPSLPGQALHADAQAVTR
jgi:hypothetical protein